MCYFRVLCFFFNDTATTEIYTLSLHDALPISRLAGERVQGRDVLVRDHEAVAGQRREEAGLEQAATEEHRVVARLGRGPDQRSEEHTAELQSRQYLVCRLLLEKKKKKTI